MIIIVGVRAEIGAADSIPTARQTLSACVPGLTTRLQALGICFIRMEYQGESCQGGGLSVFQISWTEPRT